MSDRLSKRAKNVHLWRLDEIANVLSLVAVDSQIKGMQTCSCGFLGCSCTNAATIDSFTCFVFLLLPLLVPDTGKTRLFVETS